jgi:hypothetical protein
VQLTELLDQMCIEVELDTAAVGHIFHTFPGYNRYLRHVRGLKKLRQEQLAAQEAARPEIEGAAGRLLWMLQL